MNTEEFFDKHVKSQKITENGIENTLIDLAEFYFCLNKNTSLGNLNCSYMYSENTENIPTEKIAIFFDSDSINTLYEEVINALTTDSDDKLEFTFNINTNDVIKYENKKIKVFCNKVATKNGKLLSA